MLFVINKTKLVKENTVDATVTKLDKMFVFSVYVCVASFRQVSMFHPLRQTQSTHS